MAVDPGQAPREDTPQGKERDYVLTRAVVITITAQDPTDVPYIAALGTKYWKSWDWQPGSEPEVEAA